MCRVVEGKVTMIQVPGSKGEALMRALSASQPVSNPGVEAICGFSWFSPPLRKVFLRIHQLSALLKNRPFQISIPSGTQRRVKTSSLGKRITNNDYK